MYVNMPTRMHTYVYVYMHCHVRVLLHLARTLTIWPLRASPSREESSGLTRSESRRCQLCTHSQPHATRPVPLQPLHSAVCCPSLSPYLQHTHVFPILPNILPNILRNIHMHIHLHISTAISLRNKLRCRIENISPNACYNVIYTSTMSYIRVQAFGEMFYIATE